MALVNAPWSLLLRLRRMLRFGCPGLYRRSACSCPMNRLVRTCEVRHRETSSSATMKKVIWALGWAPAGAPRAPRDLSRALS